MTKGSPRGLKLGCPVWAYKPWGGIFFTSDAKRCDFLPQYPSVFNAVERNSSFYGLPSEATIQRWCQDAPESFEFCFKFPRVVSHDLLLKNAEEEANEFIDRVRPLGNRLGPFFLQLPPRFSPRHVRSLANFLKNLPKEFSYSVEVRKPQFFDGSEQEVLLNDTLSELGVNRVIFDTRAMFSGSAEDEDTEAAQRRKPSLPVKKVSTADKPFVRFVGHPDQGITETFLRDWVESIMRWLDLGLQPYFFTHMPDDLYAPHLGRRFLNLLIEAGLDAGSLGWPFELETPSAIQTELFTG